MPLDVPVDVASDVDDAVDVANATLFVSETVAVNVAVVVDVPLMVVDAVDVAVPLQDELLVSVEADVPLDVLVWDNVASAVAVVDVVVVIVTVLIFDTEKLAVPVAVPLVVAVLDDEPVVDVDETAVTTTDEVEVDVSVGVGVGVWLVVAVALNVLKAVLNGRFVALPLAVEVGERVMEAANVAARVLLALPSATDAFCVAVDVNVSLVVDVPDADGVSETLCPFAGSARKKSKHNSAVRHAQIPATRRGRALCGTEKARRERDPPTSRFSVISLKVGRTELRADTLRMSTTSTARGASLVTAAAAATADETRSASLETKRIQSDIGRSQINRRPPFIQSV